MGWRGWIITIFLVAVGIALIKDIIDVLRGK